MSLSWKVDKKMVSHAYDKIEAMVTDETNPTRGQNMTFWRDDEKDRFVQG